METVTEYIIIFIILMLAYMWGRKYFNKNNNKKYYKRENFAENGDGIYEINDSISMFPDDDQLNRDNLSLELDSELDRMDNLTRAEKEAKIIEENRVKPGYNNNGMPTNPDRHFKAMIFGKNYDDYFTDEGKSATRDQVDQYMNGFLDFNDRINGNSRETDPTDKLNDMSNEYDGMKIRDVFDCLTKVEYGRLS